MNFLSTFAIAASAILSASCAVAQTIPHVHKQDLKAIDYPAGHRTLMIRTSIDAHATMPLHTHPGIEAGYVLQGSATVRVTGRPDQSVTNGESFIVPPNTLHSVVNTGDAELVVLTTYVVVKGKPVVELAK